MIPNECMGVSSLIQNIQAVLIAKASSSYFAHVAQLCAGMDNEWSHVLVAVGQEKYHQCHQLTFTEEDSNKHGRTKKRR